MLDQGKITAGQLGLLLVTLVLSTSVLFVPAVTAELAGRDGWMSVLILATFFGLLVAWVGISLGLRFPKESIIEYSPKILGPLLGQVIGFTYIFFFIWVNSVVLREFGDLMVTAFMPETPKLVFVVALVLLAGYAVKNGLEVMARANQFLFPMLLASILALVGLAATEFQVKQFLPVLENGITPVLKGSFPPSAWRGEIVLLVMMLPNLSRPQESRKASAYAVVFLGVVLTLDTMVAVGVFGAELTSHLTFPFFALSRYGQVTMLFQRMEALVVVIWVAGVMVKVALFYYCAVLALAQWLNLKDFKPLVLPVGVILTVWSFTTFENSRELVNLIAKTWPPYAFTFELLIPALLLVVARVRKTGGNRW